MLESFCVSTLSLDMVKSGLHFQHCRPPADCYQYITGISGRVQSLNYPTVALDDVDYTICVRQESGYCGIQWTPAYSTSTAAASPDPFQLGTGIYALAVS